MPTKVVLTPENQRKLKVARRLVLARSELAAAAGTTDAAGMEFKDIPKPARRIYHHYQKMLAEAEALGVADMVPDPLPGPPAMIVKSLRRLLITTEELSESDATLAASETYKDFMIQIWERLDVNVEHRFQPTIVKDGEVVHEIHIRAKRQYVAVEHFAKRAIDHFLKMGSWPEKLGVSLIPM